MVAFLILIILIGVSFHKKILAGKINKRLTALKESGIPISCEDLNNSIPKIPPDKNAATYYIQAFAKVNTWLEAYCEKHETSTPFSDEIAYILNNNSPLSDHGRQLIGNFISEHSDILDLFQEAAQCSVCYYPVDYKTGSYSGSSLMNDHEFKNPEWIFSDIPIGMHPLNLASVYYLEKGEFDKALLTMNAAFKLSN